MNKLSFKEDHISQIPALLMLQKVGYTYITPDEAMQLRNHKTSAVLLTGKIRVKIDEGKN